MIEFIAHAAVVGALICAAILCVGMYIDLIKENRQSTTIAGNWFNKGGKDRAKNRSKTFHGIAQAMAEQWGGRANGG